MIRSSSDLEKTLQVVRSKNFFGKLFSRVNTEDNKKILVQSLAGRLTPASYSMVNSVISGQGTLKRMLENSYGLQQSLKRYGLTATLAVVSNHLLAQALKQLKTASANQPFTGSGSTGIDPKTLSINNIDKALLAIKDTSALTKYGNPIPGSLSAYLATLTADERKAQASALLHRPIISLYEHSYYGPIPSRVNLIKVAARTYNLEPALVAAFVLAEQRDQSKNEDAKDFTAATSMFEGNTSVGLGQVVVSTARRHDLFDGLLSPGATKTLSHDELAILLTSDDFNIFAVAKYIRLVADAASTLAISTLPNTQAAFPGINLPVYKNNSSTWPDDNIRALASEYTSRAWDDRVSPGWGYFVFQAYLDMKASGAI